MDKTRPGEGIELTYVYSYIEQNISSIFKVSKPSSLLVQENAYEIICDREENFSGPVNHSKISEVTIGIEKRIWESSKI